MGSENLGKTCGGGPNPLGHCGDVSQFGDMGGKGVRPKWWRHQNIIIIIIINPDHFTLTTIVQCIFPY